MRKKIVLFDIDHTLFHTSLYLRKAFVQMYERSGYKNKQVFLQTASNIYLEIRKDGNFTPEGFCKKIHDRLTLGIYPSELEKVWWGKDLLKQSLYKDVLEVFEELYQDKNIVIGIFSTGLQALQKEKIQQLEQFLTIEHVHVFDEKEANLRQVIRKYHNSEVFFVDDSLSVLQNAKRIDAKIVAIWVNRDALTNPLKQFTPDKTVSSVSEVPFLVKKA